MAKFGGVDFIDFDSQLNDEEKLVRQTAREFVENEVIPIIEKHSREAMFPMHFTAAKPCFRCIWFRSSASLGFLAPICTATDARGCPMLLMD